MAAQAVLPPSASVDSLALSETPPVVIICKPSTSLADVVADLKLYAARCRAIVAEYPHENPTVLKQFCDELEKWLTEDHVDLDPLTVLEQWKERAAAAQEKEEGFCSMDMPPIYIQK